MCNHARSLAERDFDVTLVGYAGSALPEDLQAHQRIQGRKHGITSKKDTPVFVGFCTFAVIYVSFSKIVSISTLDN